MMVGEAIVLDLSVPEDAPVLEGMANLAQPEAVATAAGVVRRQLETVLRVKTGAVRGHGAGAWIDRPRSHEAMAVLGGRGSGKTTFLRSILAYLEAGDGAARPWQGRILSLGLIDPTLLSAKDNLFLGIISRIQDRVETLHLSGHVPPQTYKAWTEALLRLSAGLSALDDVGPNPLHHNGWEEAEYALEEGLATIRSNRELEATFGDFLDQSLALLRADAFAIGLDDIDIGFDRGWLVLETLRRYLTASRLIVFIAGDMELFSTLVRKRQWENLGALPDTFEPDRKRHFDHLVDRLEDQYLLKLLKPANRLTLLPLKYYVDREGQYGEIQVKLPDEKTPKRLWDVLDGIIERLLFLRRPEDKALYVNLLLNEPIRTVLTVLRAGLIEDGEKAAHALAQALSGPLRALGLHPDRIRYMTGADLGALIVQPLIERDAFSVGLSLSPKLRDHFANLGLFALTASYTQRLARHPYFALESLIRVAWTHATLPRVPTVAREQRDHLTRYMDYTGLTSAREALDVARRADVFQRTSVDGKLNHATTLLGSIALGSGGSEKRNLRSMYGSEGPSREHYTGMSLSNYHHGNLGDTDGNYEKYKSGMMVVIDDLLGALSLFDSREVAGDILLGRDLLIAMTWGNLREHLPAEQRVLFSLLITMIGSGSQISSIVSINALLGALGGVMMRGGSSDVAQYLLGVAEVKVVPAPMPRFPPQGAKASQDLENEEWREAWDASPSVPLMNIGAPEPMEISALAKRLAAWGDACPVLGGVSLTLLDNVWRRFTQSLVLIDEEVAARQSAETPQFPNPENWNRVYCGDLPHRYIVAFLDAVLIEEGLARGDGAWAHLYDSSAFPDHAFVARLSWWEQEKFPKSQGLFETLWRCPLWGHYLDPRSPVFDRYTTAIGDPEKMSFTLKLRLSGGDVVFRNLHPLLNAVLLRRPENLLKPAPGAG